MWTRLSTGIAADRCFRLPGPSSHFKRLKITSIPHRRLQKTQARPHGHEQKLVKNWNGTSELPEYNFGSKILEEGSFGGDVLELQRFLGDQGYFPRLRETPDGYTGYFGDLTKEALQSWQQDRNIAADGCFGPTCRQAVALQQREVRQQHTSKQRLVQQDALTPKLPLSPTQIGGVAFALGAVAMLGYQIWAWWRSAQQVHSSNYSLIDQQDQLDKWQGTIADDRSRSSSPQPSYAWNAAARSNPAGSHYAATPSYYARPNPPQALGRPPSAGSSMQPIPSSSSTADAVGPAVSLDGYPRYKPQWGVGLPEQKKYVPPTPARREPSDRAKAVMTHPGTPGYPKGGAAGGTRAAGNGPRAAQENPKADAPEPARKDHGIFGRRPKAPPSYQNRPRSPNPTAMPGSLNTPPPLKPTLDPSAKSWIEIAVSQRGPHDTKAGHKADGRGSRLQPQTPPTPGSSGSGVAQVLSVEDGHAQQAGESTMHHRSSGSGVAGKGSDSHDGGKGNAKSGTKTGGISLFGSFKAPMKRQ